MKKLVIGILAHVDAGKTTLAESMLYRSGSIRKLGRVDHKDAFLDTYELERARGITIFSKQAVFTFNNMMVSLLDTPGHVDFATEMERTLQVLDYAILVISGSDGVQGHTETLWKLLERYKIPTFTFVNKMDLEGTDPQAIMLDLKNRLSDGCINFSLDHESKEFMENLAVREERVLDKYLETDRIETKDITRLIENRKVFPCYFGSALKLDGVDDFLNGIKKYTKIICYPKEFGAKIYKISHDDKGNRLTHMKITGGSLKVKMLLSKKRENGSAGNQSSMDKVEEKEFWEEKVNQIRIYSGNRYEAVDEVKAGDICAVLGLSKTYPGEGLGTEKISHKPFLAPVLNYRIILEPEYNPYHIISKLRQLEEEDPQMRIVWSEQLQEIHVQLMGEIQLEILKSLILERFGINVKFDSGNIVYKETIQEPVIGVGHYEPLRHYAEVQLLLEPNKPGSGLTFASNCSEDILDSNWQRLILTHLKEKNHVGVLAGSAITDMKITVIAGRAHLKHTEGGDFRQATYRAVRQGLKKAKSILLEPYYNYKLEIPSEFVGKAMSDIQRMYGDFEPPEIAGDMSILIGSAPVSTMREYHLEVMNYTRGRGRLFCTMKGYYPCHNTEEVIKGIGYESERDLDNPTSSIFCSHGAGFIVEWDKVDDYKHIKNEWQIESEVSEAIKEKKIATKSLSAYGGSLQEDKELEEIFTRTFGSVKRKGNHYQNPLGYEKKSSKENNKKKYKIDSKSKTPREEYLVVDGYNIIFAWEELSELANENMEAARMKLMDILCNYQGFKKCIVILVFDAYKVKDGVSTVTDYHNIHVVYTKEAETADQYIEKVVHKLAPNHHVTVATSDALEQLIILGKGGLRLSANDLKEEILRVNDQIRREYLEKSETNRAYLKEKFTNSILEILDGKNENYRR